MDLAGALVGFKHELSRAMRTAAEQERERIAASVAGNAKAHLETVRSRAAAEAEGFRQLADQDVERIREWSKAETARIHDEAERRIGARRLQLDRHIEQHSSITEREVGSIESAVEGYRAELERFFARLTTEEDPAEFARQASMIPGPPLLDEIGSDARARALDEFRDRQGEDMGTTLDEERANAFSPTEPGPGLVGVMASAEEQGTEPAAIADTAASGEESTTPGETAPEPAAEQVTGIDADAGHVDSNGTLQRLRSLAGLSSTKRQD
jgi:hypothetical protein